jgi:hypothetical protein
MRSLKVNGNGEQRQRISDELRQLKQMSKGLRTRSLRALMDRHATQPPVTTPLALPAKTSPPIAKTPRPVAA